MKKLIWACLLLIHSASFGQDTLNTIIWEVSGKNLTKPSYLFGTNHLYGSTMVYANKAIIDNLSISELIVGEIPITNTDSSAIASQSNGETSKATNTDSLKPTSSSNMALQPKVAKLKQLLSKRDYEYVVEKLKTTYQLTDESLSSLLEYPSAYIIMIIYYKEMQNDTIVNAKMGGVQIDEYIQDYARSNGKDVKGLETPTVQDKLIQSDFFKKAKQKGFAKAVVEYLKNTENINETIMKLSTDYAKHRYNYTFNKNIPKKDKVLLLARNQSWMKQLPAMMDKQSTFVAVGLAHLGYKQGLIMELRKLGYTVNPIAMD
ncbi:MAG: TraB/GumN family protein [Bacteroidota bacterium]